MGGPRGCLGAIEAMETALHVYARTGQVDAARMQLRHGADTELHDAHGFTPLLLAARHNQLGVMQVLLQHGAQTDAVAPLHGDCGHGIELGTCLHLAAESGHIQILKFLVTAAALDLDERTHGLQEITVLHLAARLGRVDVVRFLTARSDVDVNALDSYGMTPLHHACDYPNAADDFVAHGSPDQSLFDAAHVDVVTALVHAGAALDLRRADDHATPLRCALRRDHFLVAKVLLDHGAHSGVTKWLHKIKMLVAAPRHSEPTLPKSNKKRIQIWKRRILQRDGSLWDTILSTDENNPTDSLPCRQQCPLHAACKSKSLRRLREALKTHSNLQINCRLSRGCAHHEGWTALHIAASNGWQVGLTLLIAHGANVELSTLIRDAEHGTTALHLAAQNGHISNVLALLDAGADIYASDDLGDTPLMLALRHGRSRTVRALMTHGANRANQHNDASFLEPPHARDSVAHSVVSESMLASFDPQKTTALHLAAFFGFLPVVQQLAKFSSTLLSLDAVDVDGATPIWLAALMGHLDVVDFLAQQGADLHHQVAGTSVSDCAAEFGHLEVLEYVSTSSPRQQLWERRSLTRLALTDQSRIDRRESARAGTIVNM